MSNHIAHVLRVHGVEDRVEVGSVGVAVLGVLILQVSHHGRIVFELWEDVLDSELVILWHSDELALCHRQQLLVSFEHLTQEVTVDGRRRRHVQLHYTGSVKAKRKLDLRCSLM